MRGRPPTEVIVEQSKKGFWTLADIAANIGVSRITVWRWVAACHLKSRPVGRFIFADIKQARKMVRR